MSETMTEEKNMSIRSAVMASISDARDAVVNLAKSFGEHVSGLRVNESEEVFEGLAQNFKDLQYFIYFMEEIRTALAAMKGLEIEHDPISDRNAGEDIFKEMVSAMEQKDWILLSDLVEYELMPLMQMEDKWLGVLRVKMEA